MKILFIVAKSAAKYWLNFSRSALFHMKTRVRLKYFATDFDIDKIFILAERLHTRVWFYEIKTLSLSRLAIREATRIYHAYK